MNSAGIQISDQSKTSDTSHQENQNIMNPHQLVEKAENYLAQEKLFKKCSFFDEKEFFIISAGYLREWKQYIGYQKLEKGQKCSTGKKFGVGKLPIINEDIVNIEAKNKIMFDYPYEHLNIELKSGLQEEKDYVFVNRKMWDIIIEGVDDDKYFEVNRKVNETSEGKKVQVYFQKLTIIPITNEMFKYIENEKISTLFLYPVQFSHYGTIQELKEAVINPIIKSQNMFEYKYKIDREHKAKIWLTADKTQKQTLYKTFLQGCKANSTYSYRLYFEGDKLDDKKQVNQYDILDDSFLILELKQSHNDWCFFNKKNILESQCSNCKLVKELQYFCSCKFVAYCSKTCKQRDKLYHEGRCPNNALSDQEEQQLKQTKESRMGVTGLRNLGNTCFMNSGLQCVSHIYELTQYFLRDQYLKDINKDNPLGTKGQLCTAFAKMLKNVWFGTESSFSPNLLKRAIGKFQPMFSGFNQHDSGELINYFLDGLHEDLNRVKVKPYVEINDDPDRPEAVIAAQQWKNFLMRNQSQIVDLMYGQYRSVVDCPQCGYHSIQFDPFCTTSLPLKNNTLKKIEITYIENHLTFHKLSISFDKSWNWKMSDVLNEVKKQISKQKINLFAYVASYSSCDVIDSDKKVNEVRSQHKYRVIYARQILDDENIENGLQVMLGITIPHSYYKDESYRTSVSPYRLYFFDPNMTLKQFHRKVISYFSKIKNFQNYEQEVIAADKDDQCIRLLGIANSRYSPCYYCSKKDCDGCVIPYSDQKLNDFVKECGKSKVQFQVFWRKNDKQVQKKFEEFSNGKRTEKDKDDNFAIKSQTNLSDCLKLFGEAETLPEDNAWYCPKCQDFVLAKKQMQIYKAPKILILCLKRFKSKGYYQEKFNMLVDFPVQNFDLSNFVISKNLPTHDTTQEEVNIQGPLFYDLFGISNHFGGTGGGHYTAFCKQELIYYRNPLSGQWYDFDDSQVSKLPNKSALVSQNAYLLFYKRKE